MIHTSLDLLQSQPVDISKCFNMQAHPETATKIKAISERRTKFYTQCAQLVRSDLKQPHDSFDWLTMLTYLNDGPDLLEMAVKEASYPIPFAFRLVNNDVNISETSGKLSTFLTGILFL
jgi:hypothetical protein